MPEADENKNKVLFKSFIYNNIIYIRRKDLNTSIYDIDYLKEI